MTLGRATTTVGADPGRGGLLVANAPVSYGAFEITVGVDPHVPDSTTLLDWVSEAGYVGIDLGPVGYLGGPDELPGRLTERGLGSPAATSSCRSESQPAWRALYPSLDALLDIIDRIADGSAPPLLADAGSPQRAALPGRSATDRSVGLDDAAWERFADGLAHAVARCRERGYEPTFHHHTATYIEARGRSSGCSRSPTWFCLDTGHLCSAAVTRSPRSGSGRRGSTRFTSRTRDARRSRRSWPKTSVRKIWRRRAFCALGDGDIPIDDVLAALSEISYSGWLVVEQDVLPDPDNQQYVISRSVCT